MAKIVKHVQTSLTQEDIDTLHMLREGGAAAKALGISTDIAHLTDESLLNLSLGFALRRAREAALEAGYQELAEDAEWKATTGARRRTACDGRTGGEASE